MIYRGSGPLDGVPFWQAVMYMEQRETLVEEQVDIIKAGVLEAVDNINFE